MERRYEPAWFRVADLVKDLRLAQDLYRRSGSATPLTRAAANLFSRAAPDHGELDTPAVAETFTDT